jgi:hypothetical protein
MPGSMMSEVLPVSAAVELECRGVNCFQASNAQNVERSRLPGPRHGRRKGPRHELNLASHRRARVSHLAFPQLTLVQVQERRPSATSVAGHASLKQRQVQSDCAPCLHRSRCSSRTARSTPSSAPSRCSARGSRSLSPMKGDEARTRHRLRRPPAHAGPGHPLARPPTGRRPVPRRVAREPLTGPPDNLDWGCPRVPPTAACDSHRAGVVCGVFTASTPTSLHPSGRPRRI